MFELTNEQRKCFGLSPVDRNWIRIEPKPSPYDQHTTISYLDGNVLRKVILTGNNIYNEYEICEQLSDDLQYLLPKTEKGKPVLLSAATLTKRTPLGMGLAYGRSSSGYAHIDIYCHTSQRGYYYNDYEPIYFYAANGFQQWVESWCSETTQDDLDNISQFSAQQRQHIKFREGDVFRFKINRRLYGYGRVLLDYALMRKKKEPFWDILMGKPAACSVYHIVTERKDVTLDELRELNSLPSVHIMDNRLFYGDFEIIGNIPIGEHEDYPIMYGGSISALYRGVLFQCGKLYRKIDDGTALYNNFTNSCIGFNLNFRLPVLLECIEQGSNDPYWTQDSWKVNNDLRNPKFRAELEQVCKQFGILPSEIINSA